MIQNDTELTTNNLLNDDDQLWRQLKSIPAFRALLRAVEARFYQQLALANPILDLGCGDGHFAEMTFDKPLDMGIDPWWGPLQKAARSGMYHDLVHGMGNELPFPDESFATVISNSVLEHIPDIQPVLNESSRVLQPDGRLVITMPSNYFTDYMGGAAFLERVGASGLADKYRAFFNFISRHAHTDSPQVWANRLARAGFEIDRWQYYFSKEALHALEWGHVQGLPSAILHAITGHWILAPWASSLQRTEQWVRPFYEEPFNPNEGAYMLIIAHKKANHPIEAALPPAAPFSIEELSAQVADGREQSLVDSQKVEVDRFPVESDFRAVEALSDIGDEERRAVDAAETLLRRPGTNFVNYGLVLAGLLAAFIGQTMLGTNELNPSRGVGWFVISAVPLLVLGWRTGLFPLPTLPDMQLPTSGTLARRRWFTLPGLLLALIAQRLVNNVGVERPFAAFIFWFAAIGVAWFALVTPRRSSETRTGSFLPPGTWLIGGLFFLVAFIIRVINLSNHPFILNGIEASIGMDALNIARGVLNNPFSTGWLTNPTLPAYLMAIPIKLFGPSTFAVRFWSPLIGAVTVTAVYVIGERLYGREVGVVTAVLLAGSHFHIHFSRMGMSNIWDPLLTLLALGMTAVAWEKPVTSDENEPEAENHTPEKRRLWLLAGLFTGLNAYFYTSSHLLPMILVVLLAWALFFDREGLQRNAGHLMAAAALALIVALPQLLYYNNNPTVFMQRANDVGIFPDQSDWLNAEAARSGESAGAILMDQIWRGLLAFSGELDKSPAYRPLVPLLSFGPALFLGLGVLTAVLRLRDLKYMMLVVWFVVTGLFAGAFLLDVPNSHRLVIVTPALSLLAGIALVTYGRFILSALPQDVTTRYRAAWLPVLVLLAGLFVGGDLAFYYGRFPNEHNFGDRNTEIADRVAHYLNDVEGETTTAYFFGPPSMYTDFPTIPFLAQDFQRGYNLFDVEPNGELHTSPTAHQVYIFLPERADELDQIQAQFPGGTTQSFAGYYADPLFHVYAVNN